jgi:hypothetical protein
MLFVHCIVPPVQAGGKGAGAASMQQPLLVEAHFGAPAGPSAAPPIQLEG